MKKLLFKIILVIFFVIICYLPKLNASEIKCNYISTGTYRFNFYLNYKDGKVTYLFGSKSDNITTIVKSGNFSLSDYYKNGELSCPDICMKFVPDSTGNKIALRIEKGIINNSIGSQVYCTQTVSHPVTGNDIKPRISITKDRIQYDSYEADLLDNSDDESDDYYDDDDWGNTNIPSSAPEPKKYFTQIELCSNLKFLKILKFIRLGITIIKIVVPIILLVVCSITLVKGMTAGDDKELSDVWLQIKNKVIAAILVFLIPTIITMTLDMIGGDNNCVSNATQEGMTTIAIAQINTILEEGVHSGNVNELKSLLNDYEISEELKKEAEEKIDEYIKTLPTNPLNPPITASLRADAFLEIAAQQIGNKNNASINYRYTFGVAGWDASSYGWCSAFVTYCLYALDTQTEFDIPFKFENIYLGRTANNYPDEWFGDGSGTHWPAPVRYARDAAYASSNDTYFTNDDVYYAFSQYCYENSKIYGKNVYGFKNGEKLRNSKEYIPKKGDLIMFYGGCSLGFDNGIGHIGIVESVDLENKTLTHINGNTRGGECGSCLSTSGSCVCRATIPLSSYSINGYVVWE